ncbi:MAG TPA: protein phosphatase [Pirellulales bacterium]
MNRIEPYSLGLGNAGDCRDATKALNAGIRAVMQLAIDEPLAHFPRETIVIRIPLYDGSGNSADDLRLAVTTLEHLLRTNVPTLVCCSAGMSRTPAIAAFALARIEARTPQDSLERLRVHVATDVSATLWQELLACFGS